MTWVSWLLISVGVWLLVSMALAVFHRADDIYKNRSTNGKDLFAYLLWPIGAIVMGPNFIVEGLAQLLAKYKDYRRKKKLGLNKVA